MAAPDQAASSSSHRRSPLAAKAIHTGSCVPHRAPAGPRPNSGCRTSPTPLDSSKPWWAAVRAAVATAQGRRAIRCPGATCMESVDTLATSFAKADGPRAVLTAAAAVLRGRPVTPDRLTGWQSWSASWWPRRSGAGTFWEASPHDRGAPSRYWPSPRSPRWWAPWRWRWPPADRSPHRSCGWGPGQGR